MNIIHKKLVDSNDPLIIPEIIEKYLDNIFDNDIILCSLKVYFETTNNIEININRINKNIENLEKDIIQLYIEEILDYNGFYQIFF